MATNYKLVWKVRPTESCSYWMVLDSSGGVQMMTSIKTILDYLSPLEPKTIYVNTKALLSFKLELKQHKLRSLNLTPLEYRYVFTLLGVWVPDNDDASEVLDAQPKHLSQRELAPLHAWLDRYHNHAISLYSCIDEALESASKPQGNFGRVMQWLARPTCRLYPQGVILDKHVYCARWSGTHWPDLLSLGVVIEQPKRNPAILKTLRKIPERISQIDKPAFLLVKFIKSKIKSDHPRNQSIWVSNIELIAMLNIDKKCTFEIADYLEFSAIEIEHLNDSLWSDDTASLSVSHGLAARNCALEFQETWTMSWWRSVERSRWMSLIDEVSKEHQIVVTGYGDGFLSFYCWHGEMAKLCMKLRLKAAVIKQSDQDFDFEVRQELVDSITAETGLHDAETKTEENGNESITSNPL